MGESHCVDLLLHYIPVAHSIAGFLINRTILHLEITKTMYSGRKLSKGRFGTVTRISDSHLYLRLSKEATAISYTSYWARVSSRTR